jgi:hypothetical protein
MISHNSPDDVRELREARKRMYPHGPYGYIAEAPKKTLRCHHPGKYCRCPENLQKEAEHGEERT